MFRRTLTALALVASPALAQETDLTIAIQLEPPHLDPTSAQRAPSTACFIPTSSKG